MPSEPAALVLPSSLFLLSFFFLFYLLFSLLSCYFTSWVHTFPGKYPEYPSPTYHVPAPLFCVGRSSIFEARAICLNAKKTPGFLQFSARAMATVLLHNFKRKNATYSIVIIFETSIIFISSKVKSYFTYWIKFPSDPICRQLLFSGFRIH